MGFINTFWWIQTFYFTKMFFFNNMSLFFIWIKLELVSGEPWENFCFNPERRETYTHKHTGSQLRVHHSQTHAYLPCPGTTLFYWQGIPGAILGMYTLLRKYYFLMWLFFFFAITPSLIWKPMIFRYWAGWTIPHNIIFEFRYQCSMWKMNAMFFKGLVSFILNPAGSIRKGALITLLRTSIWWHQLDDTNGNGLSFGLMEKTQLSQDLWLSTSLPHFTCKPALF